MYIFSNKTLFSGCVFGRTHKNISINSLRVIENKEHRELQHGICNWCNGIVFLKKTLKENSDGKELLECPKQKKKITREGLHKLAQP